MKRCFSFRRLAVPWLWLSAGLLVMAASVSAQMPVRQFPAAAKRGVMTVTAPPSIMINGSALRMSPGVRIRGPNNMLLMSGALIGQQYAITYVLEAQGMVREIWILNQAEVDTLPRG